MSSAGRGSDGPSPALSLGAYTTVRRNDAVLVYVRRYEGRRRLQIMLNMTGQVQPMPTEEAINKIVLSTWLTTRHVAAPWSFVVISRKYYVTCVNFGRAA